MTRYRTPRGDVLTRGELYARLEAQLAAMDPETRAANCDGTIDDLITDSVLVGIYQAVDDEHDQSDERASVKTVHDPAKREVNGGLHGR